MHPEDVNATRVLRAGGAGYITKESATHELASAIRIVANGGKYVSPSLALLLALEHSPGSQKPLHETLTDREYRVMWLLASGRQIIQIAQELSLSPSTVSTYRGRILKKLKLATNAEIVRYAISHRLME